MPPLPCRALLACCKSVIVAAAATSALLPLAEHQDMIRGCFGTIAQRHADCPELCKVLQ